MWIIRRQRGPEELVLSCLALSSPFGQPPEIHQGWWSVSDGSPAGAKKFLWQSLRYYCDMIQRSCLLHR